jgi:hypothetical protein
MPVDAARVSMRQCYLFTSFGRSRPYHEPAVFTFTIDASIAVAPSFSGCRISAQINQYVAHGSTKGGKCQ